MQESIAVGISLPKEVIIKIDRDRGDISRSRYMLRLLESIYEVQGPKQKQDQNLKKQPGQSRRQPGSYSAASVGSPTYKISGGNLQIDRDI